MKVGIVVFPGSNCDYDCYLAVKSTYGLTPQYVWHGDTELKGIDAIILPGGFSYGDYLRAGAIARFSPVMEAVRNFAKSGKYVIGICNGFQVLTEAGMLPGTLTMNNSLKFICKEINIRVEKTDTFATNLCKWGQVLSMPIAHKMGNYFVPPSTLKILEDEGRVIFRYCNSEGSVTKEYNPNGSLHNIAGICDTTGQIVGMMPHPERRVNRFQGGLDGSWLFKSIASALTSI